MLKRLRHAGGQPLEIAGALRAAILVPPGLHPSKLGEVSPCTPFPPRACLLRPALASAALLSFAAALLAILFSTPAWAQPDAGRGPPWRRSGPHRPGSQHRHRSSAPTGHTLLLGGIVVSLLGLVFGLVIYMQLRTRPCTSRCSRSRELIYETCKTYLVTQGKFILMLEVLHRRHHRPLLRRARSTLAGARSSSSSCASASSASPAATASPGSASASTRSPTRARRSPRSRASRSRATRSRSRPA